MSVDCVNSSKFHVPTFYLVLFIHLTLLIYFIIKYKIMQSEKRAGQLVINWNIVTQYITTH